MAAAMARDDFTALVPQLIAAARWRYKERGVV
jgi:hypothetical protein